MVPPVHSPHESGAVATTTCRVGGSPLVVTVIKPPVVEHGSGFLFVLFCEDDVPVVVCFGGRLLP